MNLYVRISTDEQANKEYSLRDQEAKLIHYCNERNYRVIDTYRENYSAKTFKRPEFKKLLGVCKSNKKRINELFACQIRIDYQEIQQNHIK